MKLFREAKSAISEGSSGRSMTFMQATFGLAGYDLIMSRIAFVTCLNLPEPDVDQEIMLEAVRGSGIECELAAWDDESVDWGGFDLLVLRSCWDYPERWVEFAGWVERVGAENTLLNPPHVVLTNINKKYLGLLAGQGIAVVPTVFSDQTLEYERLLEDKGWSKVVIKPQVGAGSMGTKVFADWRQEDAKAHFIELAGESGAMVQHFLESVSRGGERALVWIDGEFTHKVVKNARFLGQDESVSEAFDLTEAEREFGGRVMQTAGLDTDLLYARVDVMEGPEGEILLSELELIEPSLFFKQNPAALERFVAGIQLRLQTT